MTDGRLSRRRKALATVGALVYVALFAAAAKLAGEGVRFVGIGGDAPARELHRFVSAYEVGGMEHAADLSGDVADRFGVTSVPSFAVLYPEGGYAVHDHISTGEDLHELVAELVG